MMAVRASRKSRSSTSIPVECIDCGARVPVCPVSAIFALDDLSEKWGHYAELNPSYVEGGKFKKEEFAKHQAAK
jgi:Fe-S-cluster-containing hydrogenase component 2